MNGLDTVEALATDLGCPAKRNAPMKEYTSFRTGGPADLLVEPQGEEQLAQILRCCNAQGLQPVILGNGSNVLVADEGLRGVVLCLVPGLSMLHEQDGVITCGAGVSMNRLCRFALEKGLTGLEFAFGIPGSAGGAAFMNAGAYGGEMKDVVVSTRYLDHDLNLCEAEGVAHDFGYRHSVFSDTDCVVLGSTLALTLGDPAEIRARMLDLSERRRSRQPLDLPSAGSTFKRPAGGYAAALIDAAGLKGYAVGGAQVSEKHAGFVVNRGGATFDDVLRLMDHIRSEVLRTSGVELEPEVKIIRG